jgi:DNA-binding CsgD family transcriptional regulator
VRAANEASDAALERAIAAAAPSIRSVIPKSTTIALRSADGASVTTAEIFALPNDVRGFGGGPAVGILVETATAARPRQLLQDLGLTGAEADIARLLADGMTLREIAIRRGVSFETVRSQIKSIRGKLGVSRQVEIVSRLRNLI